MGSSKKQTVGYRYSMGLHMGFCLEPDSLLELRSGDRRFFIGEVSANQSISINARQLFGGDEREGGIQGTLDVMMGRDGQMPNAYLTSQQGGLQPGYRGWMGLVYRGLIISNNPYIKAWSARVRCIYSGWDGGVWYSGKAAILLETTEEHFTWVESFADGLTPYSVVEGSLTPFHVAGEQLNIDAVGSRSRIARAVPVPAGSQFRSLEYRFYLETAAAGNSGVIQIFDAAGVYVHGFNPRFPGGGNLPLVGYNSNEGPTSTIGTVPLTAGKWYRYKATYDRANSRLNCAIYDDATGVLWGQVSVPGPSLPIHQMRIWANGDAARIKGISITHVDNYLRAMNPAHIIYQALTDPDWGMGYPPELIDDANFKAAADKLEAEGLGLCLKWVNQSTVRAFTQTVADHAAMNYGQSRKTGKFEIQLLRQDYDVDDLPVFTKKDCRVVSYQRPSLTDTVNEIIIDYVDMTTGDDASTAPLQNLANIQAQGRIVSQRLSFPGIPTNELAARAGMRELQSRSTPLWRMKVEFLRGRATQLKTGEPFVIDMLDTMGVKLVLRAVEINFGTTVDAMITAECVEDVFGMPSATYVGEPPPPTEPPDTSPKVATGQVFEVPYRELIQAVGAAATAALAPDAGFVGATAIRPAGVPVNFSLLTRLPPAEYLDSGTGDFAPMAVADADIPKEIGPTVIGYSAASGLANVEIGDAAWLGESAGAELVSIIAMDTVAGTITVGRGCGDTTPSEWPLGTRLWVFDQFTASDPEQYVDGETIEAKILTNATGGQQDPATAPVLSVEMNSRAARPYPPGWVLVNGEIDPPPTVLGDVEVSWTHRDRVLQADLLVDTSAASIGPEPGTTYTVRWILNGTLAHTDSAIAGTSATWSPTGGGILRIEVESERDGLASWQMHVRELAVGAPLVTEDDVMIATEVDTPILME